MRRRINKRLAKLSAKKKKSIDKNSQEFRNGIDRIEHSTSETDKKSKNGKKSVVRKLKKI